jgi:hypothetical protein
MAESRALPQQLTSKQFLLPPFLEIVMMLRELMDQILPLLFDTQMGVSAGGLPPSLVNLLQQQSTQEIWRKLISDPYSYAEMEIMGNLGAGIDTKDDLAAFSQIFSSYMNSNQSNQKLNSAIIEQEMKSLFYREYDLIPARFWPITATAAWIDVEMQYRVGYAIYEYLRHTEIFSQNESCVPTFSVNTFWVLILLCAHDPMAGKRPSLGVNRTVKSGDQIANTPPPMWPRYIGDVLRSAAQKQAKKSGWAGFWDQWIISQAILVWKPTPASDISEFFTALLSLPVIHQRLPNQVEDYRKRFNLKDSSNIDLGRSLSPSEKPSWYKPNSVSPIG